MRVALFYPFAAGQSFNQVWTTQGRSIHLTSQSYRSSGVNLDEMDALKELVFDEMPAAMDLDVTLKVDAKWGPTWGDME